MGLAYMFNTMVRREESRGEALGEGLIPFARGSSCSNCCFTVHDIHLLFARQPRRHGQLELYAHEGIERPERMRRVHEGGAYLGRHTHVENASMRSASASALPRGSSLTVAVVPLAVNVVVAVVAVVVVGSLAHLQRDAGVGGCWHQREVESGVHHGRAPVPSTTARVGSAAMLLIAFRALRVARNRESRARGGRRHGARGVRTARLRHQQRLHRALVGQGAEAEGLMLGADEERRFRLPQQLFKRNARHMVAVRTSHVEAHARSAEHAGEGREAGV